MRLLKIAKSFSASFDVFYESRTSHNNINFFNATEFIGTLIFLSIFYVHTTYFDTPNMVWYPLNFLLQERKECIFLLKSHTDYFTVCQSAYNLPCFLNLLQNFIKIRMNHHTFFVYSCQILTLGYIFFFNRKKKSDSIEFFLCFKVILNYVATYNHCSLYWNYWHT